MTYTPTHRMTHIYLVLGLCVAGLVLFVNSTSNYLDMSSWCSIDIRQTVGGNDRPAIQEGLRLLKKTDRATYARICANVDVIDAKRCVPGDARVDPTYAHIAPDGCYVRGTHTVYVDPTQATLRYTAAQRRDQIAQYGLYATDFWERRGR